jgi:hypothetical protein
MENGGTALERFTFHQDDSTGILRLTTHGEWSEDDGRAFAVAFRRAFEAARAQWGVVRVLLDGRDTDGHPPNVNRHYRGLVDELLLDPLDRLAIVASNSVIKLDSNRAVTTDRVQAFLSINAAETWLRAHQ